MKKSLCYQDHPKGGFATYSCRYWPLYSEKIFDKNCSPNDTASPKETFHFFMLAEMALAAEALIKPSH